MQTVNVSYKIDMELQIIINLIPDVMLVLLIFSFDSKSTLTGREDLLWLFCEKFDWIIFKFFVFVL